MDYTKYSKKRSLISWKGQILCAKHGNDLFEALRLPLGVGAFFGLIPMRGLVSGMHKFTWLHFRTFISILVAVGLYSQTFFIGHHFATLIAKGSNPAGELILVFSGVWFYLVGALICTFFLLKSEQLCQYFDKWSAASYTLAEYSKSDKTISKHVNIITAILLLNCIGENVLYHFHAMDDERRRSMSFSKFLFDYYNSNQYFYPFFDYTPSITFVLLITNKIATFAWNFSDLFLILISRALYGKFRSLNRFIESRTEIHGSIIRIRRGSLSWMKIRANFLLITELLQEANRLLAPIIWLSFTTDIFFICRQSYEGLAPRHFQRTLINKIYVVWSLILLIGRTIGVNMMASLMSEEAHRAFKVTQYCHPDEYNDEVGRLERYLSTRTIGITGSGCFIITRSFIMKVISIIFTLEVVLLQNGNITLG